jgi:hypothetical protein
MPNKKRYTPSVALTPEEKNILERKAKKVGISYTRYMREVALGELPQDETEVTKYELLDEIRKIKSELNAIGNNMNQIAKVGNQTGSFNEEYFSEARRALFEMKMENHKAMMELL